MAFLDNPLNLFGLTIQKQTTPGEEKSGSFAIPLDDDGASLVTGGAVGGAYGVYFDTTGNTKDEVAQIQKCREISLYPEVDIAIQDIVNESIPHEEGSELITLNTDNLPYSDDLKEVFREEFKKVISILRYKDLASDIFRRWYVDGRIYYHIIVDKANLKRGIVELRLIEATKIKKIKEIMKERSPQGVDIISGINEYYIYNESGFIQQGNSPSANSVSMQGIKLSLDSVLYAPSGFVDGNTNTVMSYVSKAIRPANQLRMLEDATVVYIIARAPERRVFYVDVGSLPKLKAEQYVKDMMNQYKNKMVYDAKTGAVSTDKKYQCLDLNTKVPLLDGRTLTIAEISEEYNTGKELWAYSADPITGEFTPGLISWAGTTRKNAQVMKLKLDNGKEIICTPDHKFPVWGKGLVEAKDLLAGESMVPFYTKETTVGDSTKKYQKLFQNDKNKWEYTHRLVSQWKDKQDIENEFTFNVISESKKTVHHKNFNKNDNSPFNLVRMNNSDHANYHVSMGHTGGVKGGLRCKELGVGIFAMTVEEKIAAGKKGGTIGGTKSSMLGKSQSNRAYGRKVLAELLATPELNEEFRAAQRAGWTDDKKKVASNHAKRNNLSARGNADKKELYKTAKTLQEHYNKYTTEYTQEIYELVQKCASYGLTKDKTSEYVNIHADINLWKSANNNKVGVQKDWTLFTNADVLRVIKSSGFHTWEDYKNEAALYHNHKIVSVEYLEEKIDTGCLTIDGDHQYHNYHTFALDAGIYTRNSMLEDFWMPRRDGGKGTEITTLPGASNIAGQIDTLEYFQKKLYQSLNIPVSRLQGETGFSLGRSTEVSRDEVKFQKFVDRLRRKFSHLILEALKIQLVLKGVCNHDQWEHEIRELIGVQFQRDNFFDELKNQEVLQSRVMLLPQVDTYLGKFFSKKWVQRELLKMTDDQIEKMAEEIDEEKDDPTAQPSQPMMGGDQYGGEEGSSPPFGQNEDPNAPEEDQEEDDDGQNPNPRN